MQDLFKLLFVFVLLCRDDVCIKEVEISLQRAVSESKPVKILLKCYCFHVKHEDKFSFEASDYWKSLGEKDAWNAFFKEPICVIFVKTGSWSLV